MFVHFFLDHNIIIYIYICLFVVLILENIPTCTKTKSLNLPRSIFSLFTLRLEPYFNETWAVSPSLLPRKKQVELRELAVSSVKAEGRAG